MFRFYSVKQKKSEENKFLKIYLGVLENKEKKWIGIFLCVSSRWKVMKKKISMKKNEKKMVHNWLGYCPTVSQYNGRLYRDTTEMGMQWLENCIAT